MRLHHWNSIDESLMWGPLPMPERIQHAQKMADRVKASLAISTQETSRSSLKNYSLDDFHALLSLDEDPYAMMEQAVYDHAHRNERN